MTAKQINIPVMTAGPHGRQWARIAVTPGDFTSVEMYVGSAGSPVFNLTARNLDLFIEAFQTARDAAFPKRVPITREDLKQGAKFTNGLGEVRTLIVISTTPRAAKAPWINAYGLQSAQGVVFHIDSADEMVKYINTNRYTRA